MGDRLQGRRLDLLVLASAVIMLVFTALEMRQPVFELGGVGFTTSEIAAFIFIFAVACWSLFNRREALARRSLDVAVLLFLMSNFLSAAFAEDRPSAFKFSLRLTYAVLVYFGISRLPGRLRSDMVVAGAVTVTALGVSVIGIMQSLFLSIDWARILAPFQHEVTTFGAFYNIRAASTLSYPTVLSGYLEMALPLVAVFGIWWTLKKRYFGRRLLFSSALVVLAMSIVVTCHAYTYTRSSLAIIPASFALGTALAIAYRLGRRVWIIFALGAVMIFVIMGAMAAFDEKTTARLGLKEQPVRYGAEYELIEMPSAIRLDEEYAARLRIRNTGDMTWIPAGPGRVALAYRWFEQARGEEQQTPLIITELPRQVESGAEFEVDAAFRTPDQPGRYLLVFDLAHFSATWFSEVGVSGPVIPLEFDDTGAGSRYEVDESDAGLPAPPASKSAEPRLKLWRAAINIWKEHPVLGIGPDQYRKHYHEYVSDTAPDDRHRAHNGFLEVMANTGTIGLAAFLYLLSRAVFVLWRLLANRQLKQTLRLAAMGFLVALAAYASHSLLESFIWQTGVNLLFFTVLGVTAWLARNTQASA